MTREEKAKIIDELSGKLAETGNFYITDASGFTVEQINAFRRMCYEKGLKFKVYKNTLIKKALDNQEGDFSELDQTDVLKGYSGIIFSSEAANTPAKVIRNYRKSGLSEDKPSLKAASIDSELFIGEEHLKTLSELKSKEELVGEIIGLLQSPVQNLMSALNSGKNNLAGVLKTLSERES
jgi:large subunit ribosomal protein L10